MANFLGEHYKILANEIEELVKTIVYSSRKENTMAIITSVLAMTSNPAYQAALITALRSSGRLDILKDEIKNPSFNIEGYPTEVKNAPSEFTSDYQPNLEFVNETVNKSDPPQSIAFNLKTLVVKRGPSVIARIITQA